MIKNRSEYKKEVRNYNYKQGVENSNKLLDAKFKNAQQYWKLLKDTVSLNKPKNISTEEFANYFKAIKNPDDRFFQADEDVYFLMIVF